MLKTGEDTNSDTSRWYRKTADRRASGGRLQHSEQASPPPVLHEANVSLASC